MRRADTCLDHTGRRAVRGAIAEAEEQTAAEIVPVIAAASSSYERAEDVSGLSGATVCAVITEAILLALPPDPMLVAVRLVAIALAVLTGFVIGVVLAKRVPGWRRVWLSERRIDDEVVARAEQVFAAREIYQTAGGTGIMIYCSLFEQRATILADSMVGGRLGQADIKRWQQRLAQGIHDHAEADALVEVIRELGQALSESLPNHDDDRNELPDNIITID